jgi:hypothetical protein
MTQTLIDRLYEIDALMLAGDATDEECAEGVRLVILAEAAPDLKGAAEDALYQMEQCQKMFRGDLEFSQALRRLRAAVAKAGAP